MTAQLQEIRGWFRRSTFRKKLFPWLFIVPILSIHMVVVVGPSLGAVYYSLTDWSGIGHAEFIGLGNFRALLGDARYLKALRNNLVWLAFFLTVPFAMALVVSGLLARVRRGAMFYRTMIFLPYVLPSVIIASIWKNLLNPRLGIGAQLAKMGILGLDRAFLGNGSTVLWTLAFIDNWAFWGFLVALFLAAMQNISPDLYDAAKIDGANRRQEFLHITIPGILPTLAFMYMMIGTSSMLTFDFIWLLTQGGPAGASEVMGTVLFRNAFRRFEAGYASAIGLNMTFFAVLIMSLFGILRRRGWEI